MQIFAVDFAPIFGVVVGRVGRVGRVGLVGLVGRRAVVRRTPEGMLGCTDRYGCLRSCTELPGFCPAATSARGYGGQASRVSTVLPRWLADPACHGVIT